MEVEQNGIAVNCPYNAYNLLIFVEMKRQLKNIEMVWPIRDIRHP